MNKEQLHRRKKQILNTFRENGYWSIGKNIRSLRIIRNGVKLKRFAKNKSLLYRRGRSKEALDESAAHLVKANKNDKNSSR